MRGKRAFVGLRVLAIFAVTLPVTNSWAVIHWNEKVLHNFNGSDGSASLSGLIFDAAGNLYGTTILAALTTTGRCSSCHLRRAGAGLKQCCITLTLRARTGYFPNRG